MEFTYKNYAWGIQAFEAGELSCDEVYELIGFLVASGIINHLQGSYRRLAAEMGLL